MKEDKKESSQINESIFFKLDKNIIYNQTWAKLSVNAKSIFTVLIRYCSKDGKVYLTGSSDFLVHINNISAL